MLESYYVSVVLKTVLAALFGGLIGVERQTKHRPAGFRTHMLVCIGAMTVMVVSKAMFDEYYEAYKILADPTRMGAQVISGIGFLGAGTIIHHGASVKGLTTAASLWVVAAIGLTIGAGYYFLATVVTATVLAVLFFFTKFSKSMNASGNVVEFLLKIINKPKCIGSINMLISSNNSKILDMEFIEYSESQDTITVEDGKNKIIFLRVLILLPYGQDSQIIGKQLEEVQGVLTVEKI